MSIMFCVNHLTGIDFLSGLFQHNMAKLLISYPLNGVIIREVEKKLILETIVRIHSSPSKKIMERSKFKNQRGTRGFFSWAFVFFLLKNLD